MSDLISRSALLQKINDTGIQITFDLPVEEILGEDVDIEDFTMLVQDAIQAYKNMVIGTIKEQPTAYDISKVAAELEEESEWAKTHGTDKSFRKGRISGLRTAIRIVRKGGVE